MGYEEESERETWLPEMEASMLQAVLSSAPACLAALADANNEAEVFAQLPQAATAAFHLGRFEDAKTHADRALSMAPAFQRAWNYGNALHLGHTVLGLLALRDDDHSAALRELNESGSTSGSPQLNTFGPTMHLAKALLKRGQVDPVLAYLKQCRLFWKMGTTWLDLWESMILGGRVPNFFQHSHA
jgi:tetratricopeptide (TPR) repeat protein